MATVPKITVEMSSITLGEESRWEEEDKYHLLTKQQSKEIKELFRIFDKNKDNTISSRELGKVLGCMGMDLTEPELQTIMNELDKNGNGKIEYKEFYSFMQEEMKRAGDPERQESSVRMAFKVFDKNGDGFIDAAELRTAMKNLGEPLTDEELADMMKQADVNDDGKINYEEFIKIWMDAGDPKSSKK